MDDTRPRTGNAVRGQVRCEALAAREVEVRLEGKSKNPPGRTGFTNADTTIPRPLMLKIASCVSGCRVPGDQVNGKLRWARE
jgi:hypothetical protein